MRDGTHRVGVRPGLSRPAQSLGLHSTRKTQLEVVLPKEPHRLVEAKKTARNLGYVLDAAPMEFKDGAIQIHRVTKVPEESADALPLDLMVVTSEVRTVWQGRRRVDWERGTLSVVSPDGLVALKSMRGTGQDWDDIELLRGLSDEE